LNVLNLAEIDAFAFILILARMSSFLATWPVLGSLNVPAPLKILLSVLLSMVMFPILKGTFNLPILNWQMLMMHVGKEVLIGLILAQVAHLFFYTVTVASDLVSTSLGISSAHMFNPTMAATATPIDNLFYALAVLFFLMMNGHHMFLTGLIHSYDVVPISEWSLGLKSLGDFVLTIRQVILLGLQLAAPILVSILLINISLAIIGRAVPQINVLVTSLPVNILAGLVILIASMPFILSQFGDTMKFFTDEFFSFLKTI
jgi:flagellar biosynthetic protein FliR